MGAPLDVGAEVFLDALARAPGELAAFDDDGAPGDGVVFEEADVEVPGLLVADERAQGVRSARLNLIVIINVSGPPFNRF